MPGGPAAVFLGAFVLVGGEEDDGDVALSEDRGDAVGDHVDAGVDVVVVDDLGDELVGLFGLVDGKEAEDWDGGVDL